MTGSRGDSAGIIGIGAAVAAAYIWFRYPVLLVAGGILALGGAVALAGDLRRGRAWHGVRMYVEGRDAARVGVNETSHTAIVPLRPDSPSFLDSKTAS